MFQLVPGFQVERATSTLIHRSTTSPNTTNTFITHLPLIQHLLPPWPLHHSEATSNSEKTLGLWHEVKDKGRAPASLFTLLSTCASMYANIQAQEPCPPPNPSHKHQIDDKRYLPNHNSKQRCKSHLLSARKAPTS